MPALDFGPIAAVGQEMRQAAVDSRQAAYQGEQINHLQQTTKNAKIQGDVAAIQLKEAQKEQARKETLIPMDTLKPFIDKMPAFGKGMYDMAKDMDMIKTAGGKEGISTGDMEYLTTLGDKIHAIGDKQLEWKSKDLDLHAAQAQQKLSEATKPEEKKKIESEIAKIDQERKATFNTIFRRGLKIQEMAKDYTPESIQKWATTNNMADLVPNKIAEARAKGEAKINEVIAKEEAKAALGGDKNQTEEQLTAKELKGDKESKAILDAMQSRKIQAYRAIRPAYAQGGSNLPPGYVQNRYTGNFEWRGEGPAPGMSPQQSLDWVTAKRTAQTAGSGPFRRMVANGEILAKGVTDPKTGKKGEAELDKIVRLRNEIPDGTFGKISSDLRAFNKWDQFIAYQVSDPAMAKFKSSVIANAERLGAIYSGGGTVTSDNKMKIAIDLMDGALSKQAFRPLVESHKESIENTIAEYGKGATFGGQEKKSAPPTAPKKIGRFTVEVVE